MELRGLQFKDSSRNSSKRSEKIETSVKPLRSKMTLTSQRRSQWANWVKRPAATRVNDSQQRLGETPCGQQIKRQATTPRT